MPLSATGHWCCKGHLHEQRPQGFAAFAALAHHRMKRSTPTTWSSCPANSPRDMDLTRKPGENKHGQWTSMDQISGHVLNLSSISKGGGGMLEPKHRKLTVLFMRAFGNQGIHENQPTGVPSHHPHIRSRCAHRLSHRPFGFGYVSYCPCRR